MNTSSSQEERSSPVFPGVPLALTAAEPGTNLGEVARHFLVGTREQLQQWHDAGAGGAAVVERLTAATDELIGWLFDAAEAQFRSRYVQLGQSCAILAQGGYGRGELNPHSDIDLLVLYPTKLTPYVEMVTERILYTLWDTRLAVGHAVRSVKDCVRIAHTDLTVKTALLDARFLCGDTALWEDFERAREREITARAPGRFVRNKLEESQKRHDTYGDSVYLLEPQVKEGRGGLRDLHTALWLAKVKLEVGSPRELAAKGVVDAQELREVETARDFLLRVRNALHFLTGSHQDQLTFDLQERVAENLGYRDDARGDLQGVEVFLRDYYLQATTITRFAHAIIDRSIDPGAPTRLLGRMTARTIRPGVRIVGGELTITEEDFFARDPVELVRLVADAQRHDVKIAPDLADQMRREAGRLGEEERRDPELIAVFLGILRNSYRVYEALLQLHELRILGQVIPEWQHLLCLVLRDYFHIYTVDEHSLMGIRELERLRKGERSESLPLLTDAMRKVERVDLLFLAMLLHDIGKGLGGGHSEKGARLARDIGERLGLNEDDADELEILVRHHLVLSHAAQRRDIHDDKLVREIARLVGSPESLRRLYVMTYADMRATGPKVWNNWKDMLLGEAYLRVNEVFERGFEPEGRGDRVRRIQARVRAAVAEEEGDAAAERMEAFCASMPETYFLRTPEHLIGRDAILLERARSGEEPAVRVTHYEDREFTGFTVATRDRPGLFSTITGVLAASGLNIVGARISTSRDGIALDSFRISHLEGREIVLDEEKWERVRGLLERVLDGSESLSETLKRVGKPGILDKKARPRLTAAGVGVDDSTSDEYTIIEVFGRDRLGLLHDITRSLFELDLKIHLAKISTAVDQVLDVFYVTEADGSKSRRTEEIKAVLLPIVDVDQSGAAG